MRFRDKLPSCREPELGLWYWLDWTQMFLLGRPVKINFHLSGVKCRKLTGNTCVIINHFNCICVLLKKNMCV